MPKYEIKQFEVHTRKYIVEGDSLGAAVKKVFYEQLEEDDYQEQITEYHSINNEIGISIEELPPHIEEELRRKVPLAVEDWGVQSIASILPLEETAIKS